MTDSNYLTQPQTKVQLRSRTPIGIHSKFDFIQESKTNTPAA